MAHRERGLLPRDAATWEANAFVAFCRAARADAAVNRALALLEARLSLTAAAPRRPCERVLTRALSLRRTLGR